MASTCDIKRDNKGNILKVLDQSGNESKLFKQISELPHIKDLEQALQVYDEVLKANPNQTEISGGFFSNAISAIENIKDRNVKNAKGWINQLTDVQKNGGIRNVGQELDWIGLEDFLNDWTNENQPKNGNIPVEVLEQYINDNQIEIVEVTKGIKPKDAYTIARDEDNNGWTVENTEIFIEEEEGEFLVYDAGELMYEEGSLEEAKNSALEFAQENYNLVGEDLGKTKYENYQLEGGEAPLAKDTEILTDKGWVTLEDVNIGDRVLTRRDEDGGIEFKPIQAKPEVYSEFLYKYESPSIFLETTAKHTMVVEKRKMVNLKYKWITERISTEDLWKENNRKIPLTGKWEGTNTEFLYGYDSKEIAEFIGWYIAEGHCVLSNKTNKKSTICIAQKKSVNKEKCERLENLFESLGFKWSYSSDNHYYISCKNLTKELKNLLYNMPKSDGKYIPKEILLCNISILNRLYEGLLLGDGCVSKEKNGRKPRTTYHTISETLAGDVQTLSLLLGYNSTITKRNKGYKNTLFVVSIKKSKYCWVDNVKKEIIPYNDIAYCVTVENHAIYVRKNGRAVFTGNSSYREILLTLPVFSSENVKRIEQIDKEMFNLNSQPFSEKIKSEKDRLMEEYKNLKRQTKSRDTYKSSHWDESNILAHVRLNERTLLNGERVLFIEEVQSDWAQTGKKKGFNTPDIFIEPNVIKVEGKFHIADSQGNMMSTVEYDSEQEAIEDSRRQYEYNKGAIKDKSTYSVEQKPSNILVNGQPSEDKLVVSRKVLRSKGKYGLIKVATYSVEDYNEKQAIDKGYTEENRKESEKQEGKTPDMPYKKTDQWVGIAMRRVMQMAAQEGFDRVAWVTGEQSADRYDLSKQIDHIDVRIPSFLENTKHVFISLTNATVDFNIDATTGVITSQGGNMGTNEYVGKNLEDVIGKELTQKILDIKPVSKDDYTYSKELTESGEKGVGYLNKDGEIAIFAKTKKEADKSLEEVISEINSEPTVLEGQDLKVGGEGMKTFYNSILPKVAKKEAQRFDKNANIEVVDFGNNIMDTNLDNYTIEEVRRKDYDDGSVGGDYLLKNKNGEVVQNTPIEYVNGNNLEGAKKYFQDYLDRRFRYDKDKFSNLPNKQLSIPITDKMTSALLGPVPLFSLESGKTKYPSFKEALDNTTEKTIDIVSNGKVIATFPSTLDERTTEGLINSYIVDGILSPNKVTFNGKTYFQTVGETFQDRAISEEFFKEDVRMRMSKSDYKVSNGLIEIAPVEVISSPENSLHRTLYDTTREYFSNDTVSTPKKIDEKNLKLNLMKILSDMGVSVMSLKQYQDKFKKKNSNTPPSAEALADIVNRVIAFKDGQLNLDNLTEEVMHFIVETMPQEEIDSMSDLIKNSQEYQDHYERYNEVYKGDQKLLEKEILGKILKNITLGKVANKDRGFISRLIDIIDNFFKNLKLTQTQRDQLKRLNSLVEKFVIQQKGHNFNQDSLSQSKEIANLYSLSEKIPMAADAFQKTFRDANENRQLSSYARELRNTNYENLEGKALELAIARFLEMSDRLIDSTRSALSIAKSKNKALSAQNKTMLDNLSDEIRDSLSKLAYELSTPIEGMEDSSRKVLQERLKENESIISELKSENESATDDSIDNMVDKATEQYGEAESEYLKEEVRKVIRGEVKDMNQIFSYFGQLHHASNPVLNLIAGKIWEMHMKTNEGVKNDISEFMNSVENPKLKQRFLKELFDHKKGFMKDRIDQSSFNAVLEIVDMDAFTEVTGQSIVRSDKDVSDRYNISTIAKEMNLSPETVTEKLQLLDTYREMKKAPADESAGPRLKTLSENERGEYKQLVKDRQMPYIETSMNEKYYKDLFEKYKRLDISGATKAYLSENSSERGIIKARATKEFIVDGNREVKILYTPQDKQDLSTIASIRRSRKNIYSETGLKKDGLILGYEQPSTKHVLLSTGQYLSLDPTVMNSDKTPQEVKDYANIAFDLNVLDNEYIEKMKEEGFSKTSKEAKDNLIQYLNNIEETNSEEEMMELIMSNIDVSLSQEFYDTMNGESFLKGDALNELNPDSPELIETLKELYAKRNSLLSIHRDSSSPFEINRMPIATMEQIRSISEEISNVMKVLKLPKQEDMESAGEKSTNLAYSQALIRNNIQVGTASELKFILDNNHANTSDMSRLEQAYNKKQRGIGLTKSESGLLERHEGSNLMETKLNFAKSNLHVYYTRFAPIGYKSSRERIQNGEKATEIFQEMSNNPYLNIRVDSSFEEGTSEYKNPDYNDDYQGGYRQPKKGKFLDQEFINKFGIDGNGMATKDKELYELREKYLDVMYTSLEKMGEEWRNPYKLIQISASGTEKFSKFIGATNKKATLRDAWKDTIGYRIDDKAFGEAGKSRTIPKYYLQDLEDQSDVSTDYIYALAKFAHRANEYKFKKEALIDIDALNDTLIRGVRNSKGKELKNTMMMVNSYIDDNIFGKIESRPFKVSIPGRSTPIDVTKLVRLLTRYTSFKNLGFNAVIPITSYLTAGISKRVEEFIGDKLNRDASRMATKEYNRLLKEFSNNALDFNDNSTLYLIGQAFGNYDISNKARNAKFNTMGRTYSKIAMGAHTLANAPITPKVILSVIFDNRIVDGKIMTRQDYMQEGLRNGKKEVELSAKWKTLEDSTIYNHMDFTKTGFNWKNFDFNENGIDKKTGLTKEYLEGRKLRIQMSIGERVSAIEGQVPVGFRIQAQRHALLSTTLLHKSFLAIKGSERFRDKHFNVTTGLLDQGTWRTAADVFGEFFNTKGNFNQKVQALKDSMKPPKREDYEDEKAYNNAVLDSELKARNMKRISIEMGSFLALALVISTAMLLTDDDDEENWFFSASNLLMMRVMNESASNLSFNIIGDMGDVVENPVVVYQNATKMAKVWQAFDFREIENGRYRGHNTNTRYIMNLVPGAKSMYDLHSAKSLNDTRNAYELYQRNAIMNASTFGILPLSEQLKEN